MNQTPKEKAEQLVKDFSGIVYPYMGSSMLTNDVFPEVILRNAKFCAGMVVSEIQQLDVWGEAHYAEQGVFYWMSVRKEIDNIKELPK